MGFFKNLIKGKFKKIGQNAVSNISSGQLIKGGGVLGGIINKATNKFIAPAQGVINTLGLNNPNDPRLVRPLATKQAPLTSAQKKAATSAIVDHVAKGEMTGDEAQRAMLDINGDGKDDTTMLVVGLLVLGFIYTKMKK